MAAELDIAAAAAAAAPAFGIIIGSCIGCWKTGAGGADTVGGAGAPPP